jgi:hypothetical protein
MKKKILIATFILFTILCNSQEKKESNRIFYMNFMIGTSSVSERNLSSSLSLNYQNGKNLFTFKRNQSKQLENNIFDIIYALPISILYTDVSSRENSYMYGRRVIKKGFSFSFSTGISFIKFNEFNDSLSEIINQEKLIGIPLEINLLWFKKDKEKVKLLGLIPIGKETGFGLSSGLKLYGTISKRSYIGAGLVFGFGYYKDYK